MCRPAVPAARSLLLSRASRAGPLLVLGFALFVAAACGSSGSGKDPTRITGNFDVTSIDCNGLAAGAPTGLTARIASGRTYSFDFSSDGNTVTVEMVDPSCTWGGHYSAAYDSDTRFSLTGFGSFACAPSAAACAPILAVENPSNPNICGVAISESATLDHGAVPQSTGGTMTLSFVGDTTCSDNGGTNPLRLVLTRR